MKYNLSIITQKGDKTNRPWAFSPASLHLNQIHTRCWTYLHLIRLSESIWLITECVCVLFSFIHSTFHSLFLTHSLTQLFTWHFFSLALFVEFTHAKWLNKGKDEPRHQHSTDKISCLTDNYAPDRWAKVRKKPAPQINRKKSVSLSMHRVTVFVNWSLFDGCFCYHVLWCIPHSHTHTHKIYWIHKRDVIR